MVTDSESWLVLKAQVGDGEALDALLRTMQEPLYRYLRRLLNDPAAAEDVLQEVFVIVYRKLRWLDDPALFRPWAFRIASREGLRQLKRNRRWREQVRDEEVLAALPADTPPEPPRREDLLRLLERVSPASRAILILHYLEEMSLEEIGAIVGIPLGTVKSRLAYGLRTLRQLLPEGAL